MVSQRAASPVSVQKGVRFVEEYNTVLEVESVLNVEEGIEEKLWYPPDYHRECKMIIKREAKEWRKSGLGILLRDCFVDPNPTQSQLCLNAFTQLSDNDYFRGLERYLSQEHDIQRIQRKRDYILDVVEQARYLGSLRGLTEDERRDKLAEFSTLQSKCAEVFAQRLGKADEQVVKKGEDPEAAAELVSKLFRKNRKGGRRNSIETSRPITSSVMPTHETPPSRRGSLPMSIYYRY